MTGTLQCTMLSVFFGYCVLYSIMFTIWFILHHVYHMVVFSAFGEKRKPATLEMKCQIIAQHDGS